MNSLERSVAEQGSALRETQHRLAVEVEAARTLQAISTRLLSDSDESLYAQILDAAMKLMAADAASLQRLAANGESLTLLGWKNFDPESAAFWQRVVVGLGSACGQAIREGKRVLVSDVESSEFMAGTPDLQEYRRSGIRAVQFTPLRSRSGQPLGTLSTHWRTPRSPPEDDFRLFDVLARQAADLIERAIADAAVRESEERFRLAMNTVAAGVYTLDRQGLVTYVNPPAEAMFGWTTAELLGKKMHDIVHYKHPDGTPFPASDCLELHVLQNGLEIREYADMFIRKEGSFFPVVCSSSPLKHDGAVVGLVVGVRDDTLRGAAEQTLRESEERFRRIANAAPVMIWMSDVDKAITYLNQMWLDFTGRPLAASLGQGWIQVLHPDEIEYCRDAYVTAFDQRQRYQVEHCLQRHDGEYRRVVTTGAPRYDADGSFAGYIGTTVDITDLKQAEEIRSTVGQRLIEAHEEERAYLARELHDDVNQRLGLLALCLDDTVKGRAVSPIHLKKQVTRAREEIVTLMADLQALSHRLHPPRLDLIGLTASAAALCREVGDQQGMTIHFQAEHIPNDLSPRLSLCLYRVLQEALQNAIKHSGVREVDVFLGGGGDRIELTVRDNGSGFDARGRAATSGLGLSSMQERIKAVDGQLLIDSTRGRGTTIQARVPYDLHADTQK